MATTGEKGIGPRDIDSPTMKEDIGPASPVSCSREEERALLWKQDKRIIPICAGIYFLCFLDRSNIGNAKILNSSSGHDMQSETHMSNRDFTIALMIFLIAYALFEVPSNMLLKKLRPSRWLAFLMFSWGAVTIGLGGVKTGAAVTGVRFLLGVFEAGLFPGLVYYLTFWYKHDERSVRVAMILASATLAGAFGGAIAYGIGHMNQVNGMSGWRWLFILEGIPSCLSAFFVWFFLPDYPESAGWLSEREKDLAIERLYHEGSKSSHSTMSWEDAKATLTDWRLYGHYVVYFAISIPFSSLSLFTPSITSGLGFVDLQAQLMTVPPYAAAYGNLHINLTNGLKKVLTCRSCPDPRRILRGPLQRPRRALRSPCADRRDRLRRLRRPPPGRIPRALRMPHRRRLGGFCMHPAAPGLAHVQHLQHGVDGARDRAQRQLRGGARADPGRVGVQGGGEGDGVPDRTLVQRGAAVCRRRRVCGAASVLWTGEQEAGERGGEEWDSAQVVQVLRRRRACNSMMGSDDAVLRLYETIEFSRFQMKA
ncbi:major facilitator superfamily transporter [Colletotrichum chrysophilum]|uniref:Major facilitator superfamily transporter n=1 Tax=Colletotrichum chrysophilum TaxID=1836956 RepID=A0AAD9ABC4_9PEZI|nr:major facilitator superfamily transporter [Colletotrichum chrysophilum]